MRKISPQDQLKGHHALFDPASVNIHNAGGSLEGRRAVPGHSEQGLLQPNPANPVIYETRPPTRGARCGFRDFYSERTASRRDAYLSSTTRLLGCHLWHSSACFHFRRTEDIHKAETELKVELGYVSC